MADLIEIDLEKDDPTNKHRLLVQNAYDQFQQKTLTVLPNAATRFVSWLEKKITPLKGEAQQARDTQKALQNSLNQMRSIANRLQGGSDGDHDQGKPPD